MDYRLLAFFFVVLFAFTEAIPRLGPQTATFSPTSVTSNERNVVGDVATIISVLDGSSSTESTAPQNTCPPCSLSPWQPLFEWWTAFLTSATTFAHPVAVPFVWLIVAGVLGMTAWTVIVTEGTLMDIWAMWLNTWLSPKERETPRRCAAGIQVDLFPEPSIPPEADVKKLHGQGMQAICDRETQTAHEQVAEAEL
ncbi:hypothetical protein K488DRAFT_90319 [Vararia minispora EC-137]|uniref:Uncharacterized protein n=1 Tax=Vararia minispora EC-137 TaxID=1314806 RepID=A0ACB8Q858_9AGAM|nr:hypothetical protein K488DRAFT_90319 [Vararia minispora EC-137]